MRVLLGLLCAALTLSLPLTADTTAQAQLPQAATAARCQGASVPACDSAFVGVTQQRVYDSRAHRQLRADVPRSIQVTGRGGIPRAKIAAVVANVTAIRPTASTYLTVWESGLPRPTISSLNVGRGQSQSALVISRVGSDGRINVVADGGRTDVAVDIVGYFVRGVATGRRFHPAKPFRLFDSRDRRSARLDPGESVRLRLPALSGVASSRMAAAMVNVTAVDAKGPGRIVLHRAGSSAPGVSSLSFSGRKAATNRGIVRLKDGAFTVTNRGRATHVVVDVVGWFASKKVAGGQLYTPLSPSRILDTRSGLGAAASPLNGRNSLAVSLAGAGGPLPADAKTGLLRLTATAASTATYLRAWASTATAPETSDVTAARGRDASNLAAVRIGRTGQVAVRNEFGRTQLVVDLLGYFRRPAAAAPAPAPAPAPGPSTPPPSTTPSAANGSGVMIGMSAPSGEWAQRLREVGPGLKSRRVFVTSFSGGLGIAQDALRAGLYPVISFKTGGISWSAVAQGSADAQLRALAARLDALPGQVFVAIHHEPEGDGRPEDWAAMQEHALPILDAPDNVDVGVIGNGWWWSSKANGYTDAEIARYITPGVLRVSDVIAGDTYDGGTGDGPGDKIRRMSAWADRVGAQRLGIGEFNGKTPQAILDTIAALRADPRFAWACLFNSNRGIGDVLTGERLQAFRSGLSG